MMRLLKRLARPFREMPRFWLTVLMTAKNVSSKRSIVGDVPCRVSLTTYGQRLLTVYATIESIGRGSARPAQFTLWLNEVNRPIPKSLERLRRRGLEIRYTEDYGPHKKYYPSAMESLDRPLVTVDDDTFYGPDWLLELSRNALAEPGLIHCWRAHVVRLTDDNMIAPYNTWSPCETTEPSVFNFATGVSGVWYPVQFMEHVIVGGARFQEVAPFADDIWLHSMAVRTQTPVRQVRSKPILFPTVPGSQRSGLAVRNTVGNENDWQAAATYGSEIPRLLASQA